MNPNQIEALKAAVKNEQWNCDTSYHGDHENWVIDLDDVLRLIDEHCQPRKYTPHSREDLMYKLGVFTFNATTFDGSWSGKVVQPHAAEYLIDLALAENRAQVLDEIAKDVYDTAKDHGFHEDEGKDQIDLDNKWLNLIYSELAEITEALRKGNPPDSKQPEFDSVSLEICDVLIRCLDMAYAKGLPIGSALVAKMNYNKERPYKHGKLY